MASGGYGRGGRGAALLQALNAPVRKPGEQPPPQNAAAPSVQVRYTPCVNCIVETEPCVPLINYAGKK